MKVEERNNSKYKVSVWMISYNQERFIAQALDSVLTQKVHFDYEIVIGDDCSCDGTRAIIQDYILRFPGKIRPVFHEQNVGALRNAFEFTLPQCDGQYIACLEGDDYWSDTNKLQKQVDFLEANPDFGMVCTNYSRYFQNTGKVLKDCFRYERYDGEVRFEDYLLDMSSIGTATVMFRREIIPQYKREVPEEIRSGFIVGDTPLWLFIAARSRIAVFREETAVYRILDDSACHFTSHDKHYEFVRKGFEIADYFCSAYGKNNTTLAQNLEIKKHRAALFHAFRTMNRALAASSYERLRVNRISWRKRVSAFLLLSGSRNSFLHSIVKAVLDSGRSLKKKN